MSCYLDELDWQKGLPPKDRPILLRAGPETVATIANYRKDSGWEGGGLWGMIAPDIFDDDHEGYLSCGIVSHLGIKTEEWEWIALPLREQLGLEGM